MLRQVTASIKEDSKRQGFQRGCHPKIHHTQNHQHIHTHTHTQRNESDMIIWGGKEDTCQVIGLAESRSPHSFQASVPVYRSGLDLIISSLRLEERHFPNRLSSAHAWPHRGALSQTCDKCHLSGGFNTRAGLKLGVGGEKSGVHTSLTVGDDPETLLLTHTHTHSLSGCQASARCPSLNRLLYILPRCPVLTVLCRLHQHRYQTQRCSQEPVEKKSAHFWETEIDH